MQNSAYSKDYNDSDQVHEKSNFVRKNCDNENLLNTGDKYIKDNFKQSHSIIDISLTKQRQNGAKNLGNYWRF